jgi:hypothetical protein
MRGVAEAEMATARESEAKADVMVVTAVALRVDNSAVTLFWVEQYWRTRCRYQR